MFSRSHQLPQRKPCSLTPNEVNDDIQAVCSSQEDSRMLFTCLEDKVSHYGREKMDILVKETHNLEEVSNKLKEKVANLQHLAAGLSNSIEDIKLKIGNVNQAHFK